ncbi:hypothetical protein GQ53DRAFT_811596 [Thozetella sp. PMI_491]|nr:hypothetical protein GQ53DRAFT_811596 [Thozetella sp. PMI_491]
MNEINNYGFVSLASLRRLCTATDIAAALGSTDNALCDKIFKHCIRLFAIMVLIVPEEKNSVLNLIGSDHYDDSYAFNLWSDRPYFEESRLQYLEELRQYVPDIRETEWLVPPELTESVNYQLPVEFVRKFLSVERNTDRLVGAGSYGTLFRADFPKGNLKACPSATSIVYKKIAKLSDQKRKDMMREPDIMRSRKHPAITPLLAVFEAPDPDLHLGSLKQDLYLILPFADGGDMEKWIWSSDTPALLASHSDLGKSFILSEIRSLFSGLAFLHKEQNGSIVLHLDLKPKNILLFMDSAKPSSYTWKISDFGSAQFQTPDHPGQLRLNPKSDYAPPEFFNERGQPLFRAPGPELDVFSMGCIALQLMTLACEGWRGKAITEFARQRGDRTNDRAFRKHLDVVELWIQRLKKSELDQELNSRVTAEALQLISECVEADPGRRPFAWEVVLHLAVASREPGQIFDLDVQHAELIPELGGSAINGPISRAIAHGKPELVNFLKSRWRDGSSSSEGYESEVSSTEFLSNLDLHKFEGRVVGRRKILEDIENAFKPRRRKSRIALEYAYQFRVNCDDEIRPRNTFWLDAGNESTLLRSYLDICSKINQYISGDPWRAVGAVKDWLENSSNGDWVLVIDGLDNIKDAEAWKPMFPVSRTGRTVITTRDRQILASFTSLHPDATLAVTELEVEHAFKLFRDTLGPEGPSATEDEFKELLSLVKTPLFIQQSARYLVTWSSGGVTVRGLIQELSKPQNFDKLGPDLSSNSDRGLYAVFMTILDPFLKRFGHEDQHFDLFYMLDRIFEMYTEDRESILPTEDRQIQRDSTLWKSQYMPHFEEFFSYVQELKDTHASGLKPLDITFDPHTALSILCFARVFASGNRVDDAIALLKFTLDQSITIEDANDLVGAHRAEVEILVSLATFLEGRRSGRDLAKHLQEAKEYTDRAIKLTKKASLQRQMWRAMVQHSTILMRLGRFLKNGELFEQALNQIEELNSKSSSDWAFNDETERFKFETRIREQNVILHLEFGKYLKEKSWIVNARKLQLDLISRIRDLRTGEAAMIDDAAQELARIDAEIPHPTTLTEAESIYSVLLKKTEDRYSRDTEHAAISKAQLNLSIVWLRMGHIQKARRSLEELLESLLKKFGERDGLTREVAYALKETLRADHDASAIERLDVRFRAAKLLPQVTVGIWFDSETDPNIGGSWPDEWDVLPETILSYISGGIPEEPERCE